MNGTSLPKMKINGFRNATKGEVVDSFKNKTFNNITIRLDVHQSAEGKKTFVLTNNFQVFGYTEIPADAFKALHNMSIYTLDEFYDGLRGR